MKIDKLLAGTLAIVLIAGLGTPVFAQDAQTNLSAGMDPADADGVTSPQRVFSPQQECSDIDYIFTGTGSGSVGNTNFVNSDFIVTVWANTCNVMEIFSSGLFTVLATAAEVEIVGVGTVQVTEETGVFSNNGNGAVGWSLFDGDDLDSDIYDLFDVLPPPYDLTTDFGPLFDTNTGGFFNSVSTDSGTLFITEIPDTSFEAQLKEDMVVVGGESLSIDSTALILAGAQTNAIWILPLIVAAAAIGIVVSRKSENS